MRRGSSSFYPKIVCFWCVPGKWRWRSWRGDKTWRRTTALFQNETLVGLWFSFFNSSPRSPIVDDFLVLLFLFSLGFLSFGKQRHHLLTWSVLNIFGNIENRQQGPKSSHDDEEQKRRRRNEMMMNPITAEHSRGGGLCAPVLYSNGVLLPNWNSACTGDAVALTHIRWWSLITEITKVSAA